jgi:hypothetical protein
MPVEMWTIGFADRLRLRPHPTGTGAGEPRVEMRQPVAARVGVRLSGDVCYRIVLDNEILRTGEEFYVGQQL